MGAPVVSRSGPTRSDYKRLDELQAQGRASEAEDAYRKALDIARQMPEDLDALQMATGNLAGSLYDQARYDEVIPLFEEWQDVNEQGFGADDLRGQVGPRRWLTNSYMLAGRYEDARSTLGARLASAERTFAPGSAWIVLILATLAIVSQVEGKVEDARRYADRAVETARQRSGVLRSDTDALTTAISAAMDSSKSYVEREKALYEACQSALLKESAPAVAIKPVPTLKHPIGAGKCGACGAATDLAIPTAARQPFLDALRFDNPVTLQAALAAGEACWSNAMPRSAD